MSRRTLRINELLREEISDILRREARDPRLETMVSITDVETSDDLRHAKVFVSVLGSEEEWTDVMKALDSARPFLHRQLRHRLPDLRLIPELAFKADKSLERGAYLTQILNDLAHERGEP